MGSCEDRAVSDAFCLGKHCRSEGGDRRRRRSLLVKQGRPEDILPGVMADWSCTTLTAQAEHTPEELDIDGRAHVVQEAGGTCRWIEGHTLFHPDDLPMDIDAIPDIFTQFRKKVGKHSEVRECIAAPTALSCPDGLTSDDVPLLNDKLAQTGQTMPPADSRGVLPFKGGASEARARLKHYFWDSKKLAVYKKTRNGLVGADYSSKFSPGSPTGASVRAASPVKFTGSKTTLKPTTAPTGSSSN